MPLSTQKVWGQLRDFHRFARQEFFHHRTDLDTPIPCQGSNLVIRHRFLFIRLQRIGRICLWREGEGFCFSDLSRRGPRRSFPHIFGYKLHSVGEHQSEIEVRVAGLWTAWFIPRPLVYLWLRWIMQFATQRVHNEMLMYQLWLKKRGPSVNHAEKLLATDH